MSQLPDKPTRPRNRRQCARRGITQGVVVGVLVLVALTAAGGGGWWLVSSIGNAHAEEDSSTPEWAVATVQTIPVTVAAEGDLVARDNINIFNLIEHPDDERIRAIVEEGTWVEEGDWLYTLSSPGLLSDHEEWISRVREAEADLEEAERNLLIEVDEAASDLAQAQLSVELAQLAFQRWENGTHVQRINDLNLALEKAQRELEQAQRELENSEALYEQDFISFRELEDDRIALIEAENALATAELEIEVYYNYEMVMTQRELLSDITQAEEELERTQSRNENRLNLLQAQIDSHASELEQRTARRDDLARMVELLEVAAPASGMVLYSSTIGNRRERWYTIRPGTEVRGGWRVMVLSDTSQLIANLYVHESRINEIAPEQNVSVYISARPDEVFDATVIERKNSAVQDGGDNPHLRQYQVIVQLPADLGEDIRPGMVCSAVIFIEEIENALAIPIQAVHTEGSEHFVYVEADNGQVRRQVIELGGSSETLVHILSGLEEGERVLLRNPRPGEVLIETSS